jgi:YggT family protein
VVGFVGGVINLVLTLFLFLLFARFVVDWVQVFARSWTPKGIVLIVLEVVYSITDPPILFIRRFVPPLRLGAIALDTSFIIVLVSVYLLLELNSLVFPTTA